MGGGSRGPHRPLIRAASSRRPRSRCQRRERQAAWTNRGTARVGDDQLPIVRVPDANAALFFFASGPGLADNGPMTLGTGIICEDGKAAVMAADRLKVLGDFTNGTFKVEDDHVKLRFLDEGCCDPLF